MSQQQLGDGAGIAKATVADLEQGRNAPSWPTVVALAGALLASSGHAAHAVCGAFLFALGAAGVGLQGWHAVKRLRGGSKGLLAGGTPEV